MRRFLFRLVVQLAHRVLACPADNHRDTVECECHALRVRCVDCGRSAFLGNVYVHATNKKIKGWTA